MVEDAMGQDDTEGASGSRGRGRRRPPTIEATANDLSVAPVSESETDSPVAPTESALHEPVLTSDEPVIMGEPTPGTADLSKAAPVSETAADAPPEEPISPPEPEQRKPGFVPLLVAAVIGGVISAGGVALIGSMGRSDISANTLEPRIAAAEKSAAVANAAVQGLKTDFGKFASDPKQTGFAAPGVPAPSIDLAPLEKRLATLETTLAELGRKADSGQSSAESADRKVASVAQQTDSKVAVLNQQIADANTKVAALAAQQAKDNTAPILAVISSLRIALDRGRPFTTELGALKGLGVPAEKLEGLQAVAAKGVTPAPQLAGQFRDLAIHFEDPPVSHAAESLSQRLFSSAASLVKVRPVGAVAGEDVVAVSSRVEAALARGDADAAVSEAAKLPPAAQQQAKSVLDAIKVRQAAANAVTRLEQENFAAIAAQAQR